MIPENWAEKPHTPLSAFSSWIRLVSHRQNTQGPHSYKSILRFLLSKYLLQVTNFVNFSKYSHIQNYWTQDYGAYGRSIGSPSIIHTNIHAIAVSLLATGTLKCHQDIIFIGLYLINRVTDKTFFSIFGTKLVPKVYFQAKNNDS